MHSLHSEFRTGIQGHLKVESMSASYSNHFFKGERAASSHLHTVIFAIQKLRMDELRVKLDDIANPFSINYGKHMSKVQISEMTSNREGSAALVRFLESHWHHSSEKVQILKMAQTEDFIAARASVKLWEIFFNTEFYQFHSKKATRSMKNGYKSFVLFCIVYLIKIVIFVVMLGPFIRSMEYSLPIEIAAHVLGVFNVSDVPFPPQSRAKISTNKPTESELAAAWEALASSSYSPSSEATIVPNFVTPALLNQVYNITNNTGSLLVSQGIYETGEEWYSPADLTSFQSLMGLPQEAVAVDIGGHQDDNACDIGDCYEGNLDTQYLMAISQFTPTTYYYIDEDNFILDWLIAVSAMSAPPLVMSVSWELPDHLISATHLTAVNNQAMILSAMGVTLIAASGDNGAHDNTGSCEYSTDFPASSPFFTAVGATDVIPN